MNKVMLNPFGPDASARSSPCYSSNQPQRSVQFSKSLLLIMSSIGFGWIFSQLWRGAETMKLADNQDNSTLVPLNERHVSPISLRDSLSSSAALAIPNTSLSADVLKIHIVYRRSLTMDDHQNYLGDPQICPLGLFVGGMGSLISSSPWPILMASSFCLPSAKGEAQIPDPPSKIDIYSEYKKETEFWRGFAGFAADVVGIAAGAECMVVGGSANLCGALGTGVSRGLNAFGDDITKVLSKQEPLTDAVSATIRKIWEQQKIDQDNGLTSEQIHLNALLQLAGGVMSMPNDKHKSQFQNSFNMEVLRTFEKTFEAAANRDLIFVEKLKGLQQNDRTLTTGHNQLVQDINNRGKQLKSFASNVKHLDNDLTKTKKFIAEALSVINFKIDESKYQQEHLIELTNLLVSETIQVSTKGFDNVDKIMQLEEKLRGLKPDENLLEKVRIARDLKLAIEEEKGNRLKFDETLQSFHHGFTLISMVAGAINPEAGRYINTIGQSAVTIAASFGALSGFGTASEMVVSGKFSAFLGNINSIAGAVFAIVSLFLNDQPSIEKQILDSVKELSEALEKARIEMHSRFDRLEKMMIKSLEYHEMRYGRIEKILDTHHKNMHLRFDDVVKMVLQHHNLTMDQFASLHKSHASIKEDTSTIRSLSQEILNNLESIKDRINELFQDDAYQEYLEVKDEALEPSPGNEINLNNIFKKLVKWSTSQVKRTVFTQCANDAKVEELARIVKREGLDFVVQSLAKFANKMVMKGCLVNVPNPTLWADAVDTLIEFSLSNQPKLNLTATAYHQNQFQKIRETGKSFQDFVISLQNSPELYQNLINQYQLEIKNLQRVFTGLAIRAVQKRDSSFSSDLLVKSVKRFTHEGLIKELEDPIALLVNKKLPQMGTILEKLEAISKEKLGPLAQTHIKEVFDQERAINSWSKHFWAESAGGVSNWGWYEWELSQCHKRLPLDLDKFPQLATNVNSVFDFVSKLYNDLETNRNDFFELNNRCNQFISKYNTLILRLNEAIRIQNSREMQYIEARQSLVLSTKGHPEIREVSEIETRLQTSVSLLPPKESSYHFILYHLTPADLQVLKNNMKDELGEDKAGSDLRKAITKLGTYHVLLEAFLRLAFQSDFRSDIEFRLLFENLWSDNTVENRILTWNGKAETMPYIQLEDELLPMLENIQGSIFDKIVSLKAARLKDDQTDCGYDVIDFTMKKIELFERLFF